MSCNDFERLIALEVEGDLPPSKRVVLASHLLGCQNCQGFSDRLRASQALLKGLAVESADEATLQVVRTRVLSHVVMEPSPRAFGAWRFAFAAAAVAAVVVAVVVLSHVPRKSLPAKAPVTLEASRRTPTLPSPPVGPKWKPAVKSDPFSRVRGCEGARPCAPAQVVAMHKAHAAAPHAVAPRHPERLMVKLLTDNPNVVIYWMVD